MRLALYPSCSTAFRHTFALSIQNMMQRNIDNDWNTFPNVSSEVSPLVFKKPKNKNIRLGKHLGSNNNTNFIQD